MHICSLKDQDTTPDARMKMYFMVKRKVEGHSPQSESKYASKPARGELSGWNSSLRLSLIRWISSRSGKTKRRLST